MTLLFQLPYRPDGLSLQGFSLVWVHGLRSGAGTVRFRLRRARNAPKGPLFPDACADTFSPNHESFTLKDKRKAGVLGKTTKH